MFCHYYETREKQVDRNIVRKLIHSIKILKNVIAPLWIGFTCLKTANLLQRNDSFLITKFPAFPGTHLIDLGRMKDIFGHI